MIDQIRSEFLKIRTVRSTMIMLAVVVLLCLLPAVLITSLVSKSSLETTNAVDRVRFIALLGVQLSQILIGVIAALVIAGEFRSGTIRTTFVAEPRRLRVLLAKFVVVAVLSAVVATVMVALSSGIAGAIFHARGIEYSWTAGEAWRAHWGSVLATVLVAEMALAIATLVRNAAASIVITIVVPLIVESITRAILTATNHESWARWLPYEAGGRIASVRDTGRAVGRQLSPFAGYGYGWLWAAAIFALGGWLLVRRDA